MRLNNRIRNQAKENLGLSARLMGDGMCFSRQILEMYPFSAHSLTEDREYSIYLVTQGVRTHFVPEAISVGQATARWGDATGQRLRWYAGAFDLRKRCLGPLLSAAWRRRSLDALDRALELSLLPFSVLSVLAVGLLVFQITLRVLGAPFLLLPSVLLVGSAFAYPFLGLLAERAPWSSFRALLYGPVYAFWRVWVGLRVQLRRGQIPWVRTRRVEEEAATR
jgi:cellulose synthase/poly-beta-1,6-N-acetylglucosamine synthase-like glycosyltransferase